MCKNFHVQNVCIIFSISFLVRDSFFSNLNSLDCSLENSTLNSTKNIFKALEVSECFLKINPEYRRLILRTLNEHLKLIIHYNFKADSQQSNTKNVSYQLELTPMLTFFDIDELETSDEKCFIAIVHFIADLSSLIKERNLDHLIPLIHILWDAEIILKDAPNNTTRLHTLAQNLLKKILHVSVLEGIERTFLIGISVKNFDSFMSELDPRLLYGILYGDEGWHHVDSEYAKDHIKKSCYTTRKYVHFYITPTSLVIIGEALDRRDIEHYSLPRKDWQEYIYYSQSSKIPPCFWHGMFIYYEWIIITNTLLKILKSKYVERILPKVNKLLENYDLEQAQKLLYELQKMHLFVSELREKIFESKFVGVPEVSMTKFQDILKHLHKFPIIIEEVYKLDWELRELILKITESIRMQIERTENLLLGLLSIFLPMMLINIPLLINLIKLHIILWILVQLIIFSLLFFMIQKLAYRLTKKEFRKFFLSS